MTPPHRHEERPVAALLAPDILALLDESPGDVAAETEELHPANLADIAEALPIERVPALLRALPPARAADVLEYLDEELRTEVLEAMSARQAAALVTEMTPDDRADALEEMEEERADEILSEIPTEARGETERLLAWPPESAGGLMTTEFVSVSEDLTVEDALAAVRNVARAGRREAMYAIYATDREGRLHGVLSLADIRHLPRDDWSRTAVSSWMQPVDDSLFVVSTTPVADAARQLRTNGVGHAAVIDADGIVVGSLDLGDISGQGPVAGGQRRKSQ